MFIEIGVFLCLLLAVLIISQMKLKLSSTQDEVYIAQFSPTNVNDIQRFIKCTGLSKLKINIYIDFTLNNVRGTKNLHRIRKRELNVYQKVLTYLMEGFGNKNIPISLYGFGDLETQDTEVFSLTMYNHCITASEAVEFYNSVVSCVDMSGPRSFSPAVKHAADQSRTSGQHVVFIVTSGLPQDMLMNFENIVESSWHDVLVIIIGVGEGPWTGISKLTRYSKEKKFSNASYLPLDMYSDKIHFLKNIVLTVKGLNDNLLEDTRQMEASAHEKIT